MPVTAEANYLSTGSWGPMSEIFSRTLRRATLEDLRHGRMSEERFARIADSTERVRQAVAAIVAARPEEIALTRSTSASLEAVIRGLPWEPGDEVICTQLEHPACTGPLRELAVRRRVNVSLVQVPEDDAGDLRWLKERVTPRTRLIAFTGVSYTTGQRLPISAIGAFGRSKGILTLVDGAQCAGAIPLDLSVAGIDFCGFPLQKWLCGAEGLGALYVRDGSFETLRRDRLSQSAGVLEATAAHLEYLRDAIGWDWIFERTQSLAETARSAFADIPGLRLITPAAHAGLITVETGADRHKEIASKLRRRRIVLRVWPELGRYRISTAFFNTEREIAAATRVFR